MQYILKKIKKVKRNRNNNQNNQNKANNEIMKGIILLFITCITFWLSMICNGKNYSTRWIF